MGRIGPRATPRASPRSSCGRYMGRGPWLAASGGRRAHMTELISSVLHCLGWARCCIRLGGVEPRRRRRLGQIETTATEVRCIKAAAARCHPCRHVLPDRSSSTSLVPWFYRESPATPTEVCSACGITRYWDAHWLVSGYTPGGSALRDEDDDHGKAWLQYADVTRVQLDDMCYSVTRPQ